MDGRGLSELGVAFLDVVEERIERVVIPLAEWVVLVVVALGARERDTHENRGGRVHAIHHVGRAIFVFLLARLAVGGMIAVESCGDLLRERRVGEQDHPRAARS